MTKGNEREGVRLDKWLWAARFFKTRALAHEAIDGGKVSVNGERAKPSRMVAVGQELEIRSPRGHFTVAVLKLTDRRGPPAEAALLFEETAESRSRREAVAEMHRLVKSTAPEERPDTKDRNLIRRIKEEW